MPKQLYIIVQTILTLKTKWNKKLNLKYKFRNLLIIKYYFYGIHFIL